MNEEVTEEKTSDPRALRRARLKLVLILAMVFVPLSLATIMYVYFPHLAPSRTTNEGAFLDPMVQMETLQVEGFKPEKWTLIFVGDGHCDATCRERMYMARQVHMALGKDVNRVHRAYLYTDAVMTPDFVKYIESTHPGLETFAAEANQLNQVLGASIGNAKLTDLVLLMDPLGNLVFFYSPEKVGKPLQKDLKHLLKRSRIG